MKATIMSVHCDCERTVFKEVGWIDNMLKASLRIQDIVSKCDTTPKVVQNQKKHSQWVPLPFLNAPSRIEKKKML